MSKHEIVRVLGIDEAGRGPWAGPVVACGVVLDSSKPIDGLNDSKKLSPQARERLSEQIWQHALLVSVAQSSAQRIDHVNILQATLLAMSQVLDDAVGRLAIDEVVIDGLNRIPTSLSIKQTAIIRGDSQEPSIMAASIVAKVYRDKLMHDFATLYPGYGFERHKGYGTKVHMAALMRLGPCAIHRMSFAPVRQRLLL